MDRPETASLFDLLDQWRHLPSYRLEPRADVVFGLFLPHVLDRHLASRGISVDPRIIPEFPLVQGGTKLSDKADFFVVSQNRKHAFLVELKTDMGSLRDTQESYLNRAVDRGLAALLCDIKSMAKARNPRARRKYFHLLKAIAELDLMTLPEALQNRIYDSPHGVHKCIDRIGIPHTLPGLEIIHVLPCKVEGWDCIDFESFAATTEDRGEIGERFAASLRSWFAVKAGDKWPGSASTQ